MKKIELFLLFVCTYIMSSFSALASEPDYINDTPLESMLSHGTIHEGGILRSVISLLIVIGMIYLTAWLYKKLNKFMASIYPAFNYVVLILSFRFVDKLALIYKYDSSPSSLLNVKFIPSTLITLSVVIILFGDSSST